MNGARAATGTDPDGSAVPLWRFLAPRFWPVWMGLGAMRLVAWLPVAARVGLGRWLGRFLARAQGSRRRVAEQNIALCFPDHDAGRRRRLLRAHFESVGLAFLEMASAWWPGNTADHDIEGLEHLQRAAAGGRGVILLAGHFTTIEIGGRLLAEHVDYDALYRRFDNPLFEQIMRRRRRTFVSRVIARTDIRGMVRALREGRTVLYMPDQADTTGQGVAAPFFGVPAPTTTAPSRLARASGAAVVAFFPRRSADGRRYVLTLYPALDDFPGADPAADARRINTVIESQAREAPEQYLWIHRRFKGGPVRYGSSTGGKR